MKHVNRVSIYTGHDKIIGALWVVEKMPLVIHPSHQYGWLCVGMYMAAWLIKVFCKTHYVICTSILNTIHRKL